MSLFSYSLTEARQNYSRSPGVVLVVGDKANILTFTDICDIMVKRL